MCSRLPLGAKPDLSADGHTVPDFKRQLDIRLSVVAKVAANHRRRNADVTHRLDSVAMWFLKLDDLAIWVADLKSLSHCTSRFGIGQSKTSY